MSRSPKFASIPRCASRTLMAHSLLGEDNPDWKHSPIRAYPGWEGYQWYAIGRDAAEWYPSWWWWAKKYPDAFTEAMGFKFLSLEEDMEILEKPPVIGPVARPYGLHGWVPEDFDARYADALSRGLDFYGFCRETIMDGVPCQILPIEDLDAWLEARGLTPHHDNARA